ncbi:hypothetical protein BGW42_008662 [Actinomortierella wolfii]|nr:hypothetical protein BGW42_008662 [Actinomortierella wolfii]
MDTTDITQNTATTKRKAAQLGDLPEELLVRIAVALPDGDLARLARTSRAMYRVCWSHWVWHHRFIYRFSQRFLMSKLPAPRPPTPEMPQSNVDSTLNQSDKYDETEHTEGEDINNNTDTNERGRGSDKGKGKKRSASPLIVLRRTADVPFEVLLELYQKYSRLVIPAEEMSICHMGDRYWVMHESGLSRFGKIASLHSVWWLDVFAVFHGVPQGRYRVRWRMKVTSNGPVVGTKFLAKVFRVTEVDIEAATKEPAAISFEPQDMDSFKAHTTAESSTIRRSIKKLIPGFTVFELPGTILVEDNFSNVLVQIQNHEGWKSGMHLDYVQLVPEEDIAKVDEEQASEAVRLEAHNEEVNDEGEEYYPSLPRIFSFPLFGRAYRQFTPPGLVDESSPIQPLIVGSAVPSIPTETSMSPSSNTIPTTDTSSEEEQQQQQQPQQQTQRPPNHESQTKEIWYRLLPWMLLYCVSDRTLLAIFKSPESLDRKRMVDTKAHIVLTPDV